MPTPEGLHPSDSIQTEVDFVLRFPAGGQRTLYVRHCGRVKVLQFVYGRELPVYRLFIGSELEYDRKVRAVGLNGQI